jgi:uridine kinase
MTAKLSEKIENFHLTEQACYVIGVCGQTNSGKSTACDAIENLIRSLTQNKPGTVVIVHQDSFYIGGNEETNYDIPESVGFGEMYDCVINLIKGKKVQVPMYDFKTHSRLKQTEEIGPAIFIIMEGILIFSEKRIRDLCDLKVFIKADPVIMYDRRQERDTKERGRSHDEVKNRYFDHVIPSSKIYVDPYETSSDIILMNNIQGQFIGLKVLSGYIQMKVIEMLKLQNL